MIGGLPAYRFQLPMEVLEELIDPEQKANIEAAIAAGSIDLLSVDNLDALALFGDLRELMGRGEAACLAVAATSGCYLASDEKKRFRRKAIELIGEKRILRTENLLVEGIRCGRITIAQADGYKQVLAENRYVLPFVSFAEYL